MYVVYQKKSKFKLQAPVIVLSFVLLFLANRDQVKGLKKLCQIRTGEALMVPLHSQTSKNGGKPFRAGFLVSNPIMSSLSRQEKIRSCFDSTMATRKQKFQATQLKN